MKLAIIDIGAGNIFSVIKAIKNLNFSFEIINKSNQLNNYSHLIIPGVRLLEQAQDFYLKMDLKMKYSGLQKNLNRYLVYV